MRRVLMAVLAVTALACRKQAPHEPPRPPPGELRGRFGLTYYFIATQPEGDRGTTTLFASDCKPITTVSAAFADDLAMCGAGRLHDQRVLGVEGDCDCSHSPCVHVLPPG